MSFWKSTIVKSARTEHTCCYCNKTISKGEGYRKEAGTYEGEFHNYNLCERCRLLIETFEEGEELSDFHETVFNCDLITCPSCGGSNLRDYELSQDKMTFACECDNCDEKWTADFTLEGVKELVLRQ